MLESRFYCPRLIMLLSFSVRQSTIFCSVVKQYVDKQYVNKA